MDMSIEPVRVASVGLGRWAEVIATAAGRSQAIQVVNCFSRSEQKRESFAEKFGCAQSASYEELLRDDSVEAVLVTTPNPAHAETIEQAAAAGKHVWVEKPIAHTMADARRIAQAVRENEVTFAVGHSARLLGASRKIKQLVDQGELGQVVLLEANWSNERALELTPDKWRYYAQNSPGGPLIQLLVHHFDTLQYIFGPIAEVQAYTRHLHTSAEVDDVATVIAQFESGHLGYIGGSWVSPGIYWINVYGSKANLYHELDFSHWRSTDVDQHTTLYRQAHGEKERQALDIPVKDMFRDELEDFARAIRSGEEPEVGLEQALRALAVVEAAILSSQEGRPVRLKELLPREAAPADGARGTYP